MFLEDRFQEKLSKLTPVSESRLWFNTLVFSVLIFLGGSLYLFARRGNYDLFIANKVLATTALVLIGLSLALSGICYFWDFADRQIVYRRHLGLAGFSFAIVHVIVVVFFLSEQFPYPEWFDDQRVSVVFALLALLIFSAMAIISCRPVVRALGPVLWRKLLRIGYVAFIFVVIHFTLLKYPGWMKWLSTGEPFLPPLSLLEVIFALSVLFLRVAVWIDCRRKSVSERGDEGG